MGRYIVKLPHPERPYIEWSSISDAPTTYGLSREEMLVYLRLRQDHRTEPPEDRLARADDTGTSAWNSTLEEVLSCNRAGPNEEHLTAEEIVARYCGEEHPRPA